MMLKLGVVGLGTMGRHHVRVLSELDDVHLIGVVDPRGDRDGVARGARVLTDLDQLIGLGVDACVVAAPTGEHCAVGLQLAEAGVHTLFEKPLADSVESGRRLVKEFESRGLVGAVGHVERYNPALIAMRDRLDRGDLGEVFQITTSRQGPFPNRIQDVGVVKDLATHDFDLTSWIAGSQYASVSARMAHRAGRIHEDLIVVTAVLDSGIVVNHLVNWLSPTKDRSVFVTGEHGRYGADLLSADLTLYSNASSVETEWDAISSFRGVSEGDVTRFAIAKPEPLRVELEQFCRSVRGEDARTVSLFNGLAALEVAEAVIQSALSGRTVELEAKELAP